MSEATQHLRGVGVGSGIHTLTLNSELVLLSSAVFPLWAQAAPCPPSHFLSLFRKLITWLPSPQCVAQEPCAIWFLVVSAPRPGPGGGQESREAWTAGWTPSFFSFSICRLLRWFYGGQTLGPVCPGPWVPTLMHCGVGFTCLLCKVLGSVQPLRKHLWAEQPWESHQWVLKPGGRDWVVFLEELTQQGRSWPGGCGRRWTTDSVFGPP